MKNRDELIAVGMSGGVDSSVAALLLKEQGLHVIGLFMKNWEEDDPQGNCLSSKEAEDAAAVCSQIGIPFYSVNFIREYRDAVFEQFLSECKAGLTPNPDVLCNREIKFKAFLNKARELGASRLATGHYCRTDQGLLFKGADPDKDQSYFLHAVDSQALRSALFPIGHLCKKEVRELARKASLPTSEKKDSTGICFIGERNFKAFLGQFLGFQKGPLLTLDGRRVGEHDGIAYYTIGQRRGLGLGGEGEAWYVVGKNLSDNAVYVARGEKHPALFFDELIAEEPVWISKPPDLYRAQEGFVNLRSARQSTIDLNERDPCTPSKASEEDRFCKAAANPNSQNLTERGISRCSAKIRYRQKDTPCALSKDSSGRWIVSFDIPQRAITPGQSVVFYDGDQCLGGAVIHQAGPSYYEMKKDLF